MINIFFLFVEFKIKISKTTKQKKFYNDYLISVNLIISIFCDSDKSKSDNDDDCHMILVCFFSFGFTWFFLGLMMMRLYMAVTVSFGFFEKKIIKFAFLFLFLLDNKIAKHKTQPIYTVSSMWYRVVIVIIIIIIIIIIDFYWEFIIHSFIHFFCFCFYLFIFYVAWLYDCVSGYPKSLFGLSKKKKRNHNIFIGFSVWFDCSDISYWLNCKTSECRERDAKRNGEKMNSKIEREKIIWGWYSRWVFLFKFCYSSSSFFIIWLV